MAGTVASRTDAAMEGARDRAARAEVAARVAARRLDAGRRAVTSLSQSAVSGATTAWRLVRARRTIVAGAGASVAALVGAGYAAGRHAASRDLGPVTRLTNGRI